MIWELILAAIYLLAMIAYIVVSIVSNKHIRENTKEVNRYADKVDEQNRLLKEILNIKTQEE